jgi:vacuolar-type H+-ATPase subunit E/Vma4
MTVKEWRNHTDERIAAIFVALDDLTKKQNENARQIAATDKQISELTRTANDMFAETNRRINENWDKTQEGINMLLASQIKAEQRMAAADKRLDRLEENIDRVINKVDSWLDSLQSRNGKS